MAGKQPGKSDGGLFWIIVAWIIAIIAVLVCIRSQTFFSNLVS